jgi:hypothetical protein
MGASRAAPRQSVRPHAARSRPAVAGGRGGAGGLLRLQRLVGNRAVSAAIQRAMMGFEIETGIPISRRRDRAGVITYRDIRHRDFQVPVLVGGHSLHVDHIPAGAKGADEKFKTLPIIEFVSAPVDESTSRANFINEANTWLNLLVQLRGVAAARNGQASPDRLDATIGAAPDWAMIGMPRHLDKLDRVAPQATGGLRIDRVSTVFQQLSQITRAAAGTSGLERARAQAADEAIANADAIITRLRSRDAKERARIAISSFFRRPFGAAPAPPPALDVTELRGFLVMVSHYLRAGRVAQTGYAKNRPAVFYKSKLSDVRNDVAAGSPYAARLLAPNADPRWYKVLYGGRPWLKRKLLAQNDRSPNVPLFPNTMIGVGPWLDEVLSGTDDHFFDQAKNPWSQTIAPAVSGGRTAPVIEFRQLPQHIAVPNLSLSQPANVVTFLADVFDMYKAWNA